MVRIVTALVIVALAVLLGRAFSGRAPGPEPRVAEVVKPIASTGLALPGTSGEPPPPVVASADGGRHVAVVESPLSEAVCPPDMLLVDAVPCPGATHRCLEPGAVGQCARFAAATRCKAEAPRRTFCIDRYEYPNVPGALPAMLLTFEQAESACGHEDKRLCTSTEWSLACAGPTHAPYPQGWVLAAGQCNLGPGRAGPPVEKLWNARGLPSLVDEYDHRAPAGSSPGCTSAFGVADMLGNVSEWVKMEGHATSSGGLAGGDFTSGAALCGAVRRIGGAHYAAFGVGARCCADPLVTIPRHR